MHRASAFILSLTLAFVAGSALADPGHSVTDFSHGTNGWDGIQPSEPIEGWGTFVDSTGGAGGSAGLHTRVPDSWFATWHNTDASVIGDYTKTGGFTIGLDIRAESIVYLDMMLEVQRNVIVELRDHDNTSGGLPYTSVWYNLGSIGAGIDWQHLSVTVANPLSNALPTGWGGYGGEDAVGNPILPTGTTFADVLKGVDEVVITTAEPGWFYGFTYFDVTLDNIAITAVPEPATVLMQGLGLAVLVGIVRRRAKRAA